MGSSRQQAWPCPESYVTNSATLNGPPSSPMPPNKTRGGTPRSDQAAISSEIAAMQISEISETHAVTALLARHRSLRNFFPQTRCGRPQITNARPIDLLAPARADGWRAGRERGPGLVVDVLDLTCPAGPAR
jgi:hypothetical protein